MPQSNQKLTAEQQRDIALEALAYLERAARCGCGVSAAANAAAQVRAALKACGVV